MPQNTGAQKKIAIVLGKYEGILRLVVSDDGQGITSSPNGKRGMGIDSMRYRARMLGGDLRINSIPSEGMVVACEIPHNPIIVATTAS